MKKINFLPLVLILLVSCGGIKEAGKVLRNEKITTTDEFLIEKRNPLVIPPDSQKVPEPDSVSKKSNNEQEEIQSILRAPKEENINKKKSSSIEDSILNRISK
jgi:hypothetical protein